MHSKAIKMRKHKKCKWIEDLDGNWETDCENMFVFNDGTPEENSFEFCCYCGKPICQVEYKNKRLDEVG